MSVDNYVGKLVSFEYLAGSHPGATRVVNVSNYDGKYLQGTDYASNGEFRNFSVSNISNLAVLADNTNEVNVSVTSALQFLANNGAVVNANRDNSVLVTALVNHFNSSNKNEKLYVVGNNVVSVKKRVDAVTANVNKFGSGVAFSNGYGSLSIFVSRDSRVVSVSFMDKDSNEEATVVNTPFRSVPADVLRLFKKFLGV
jgi:hypothetical protein